MEKDRIEFANKFLLENNKNEFTIEDFLKSGLAYQRGITEKDVDGKELDMGIDVEMEHIVGGDLTDEQEEMIAKSIALDHLAEIPDYYTRLDLMEKEALEKNNKGVLEEKKNKRKKRRKKRTKFYGFVGPYYGWGGSGDGDSGDGGDGGGE